MFALLTSTLGMRALRYLALVSLAACAACHGYVRDARDTSAIHERAPAIQHHLTAAELAGLWEPVDVRYLFRGTAIRLAPQPGEHGLDSLMESFLRQAGGPTTLGQAEVIVALKDRAGATFNVVGPSLLVTREFDIDSGGTVTVTAMPGMDAEIAHVTLRLHADSTFTLTGGGYQFAGRATSDTLFIDHLIAEGANVNRGNLVARFHRKRIAASG